MAFVALNGGLAPQLHSFSFFSCPLFELHVTSGLPVDILPNLSESCENSVSFGSCTVVSPLHFDSADTHGNLVRAILEPIVVHGHFQQRSQQQNSKNLDHHGNHKKVIRMLLDQNPSQESN